MSILFLATLMPVMSVAQKCTIIDMNTKTVIVNGRELKKGDTFTLTDCKTIEWVSDEQYVIVIEEDGRNRQFTKQIVCGNNKPWSLKDFLISAWDYATRTKTLATKGWTPQYHEERVQLVDTLVFRLDNYYIRDGLYIAACSDGNFRERTKLSTSPDGKSLYLTRAIYGHHEPPKADTYVCILRYDLNTNAAPDSLGFLLVQPLPLDLEAQKRE